VVPARSLLGRKTQASSFDRVPGCQAGCSGDAQLFPKYRTPGTDQRYLDLGTLQARRRTFFMYGMGVSESYANSFQGNSGGQDNSQFFLSPHVAIINASNYSSFSFQYAPFVAQSTQACRVAKCFMPGPFIWPAIAPNWALQLSSTNTYGTDSSRLLSPPAFDVNKGVPVVDPIPRFPA